MIHGILSSRWLKFFRGHYNILLICLFVLFIFRPYDRTSVYLGIWKLFLTGTILSAIFNCNHSRSVKIMQTSLAIPTVLLCWWDLWLHQNWSLITTSFLSICFTFLATTSIIYDILTKPRVTFETLKGVICAYFLVAIGFAYLFWFIEWCIPGTFAINDAPIALFSYSEYLSEMFYFSFTTLLTIGFGDVVAVQDIGQTAVIVEGIFGQFYMAILVARLVSSYTLSTQIKLFKKLNHKE